MIDNNKNKDAFRKFTITFLMLAFSSFTVYSQVTKKQFEEFYKKNQQKDLEHTFNNMHNQTKCEFYRLSVNDTLKKINEIFNLILPERQKSETIEYFFLQSNFPKTFINNKELTFTGNFIASTTIKNFRPIIYDSHTINEILEFIGSDPYNNPIVKDYMRDKEKMKRSKLKEAERLIYDYRNKSRLIGEYVILPGTWGKLDRNLVPYKVDRLKFNSDLTEVEVTYDLTSSGAIEIYKIIDGKWKHQRTVLEWID